jgi:hypothetical protein
MTFREILILVFGQPRTRSTSTVSDPTAPPVIVKPPRAIPPPRPKPTTEEQQLKELIKLMEIAALATDKRPSLPILECVHLSPGQIGATDLEVGIRVKVPWLTINKPICVSAVRFKRSLQMAKPPLKFEVKGLNLHLNSMIITGYDADEYPAINADAKKMAQLGKRFFVPERLPDVFIASSSDESRITLSGVYFDCAEEKIIASDGHRMHLAPLDCGTDTPAVIVPPLAALRAISLGWSTEDGAGGGARTSAGTRTPGSSRKKPTMSRKPIVLSSQSKR